MKLSIYKTGFIACLMVVVCACSENPKTETPAVSEDNAEPAFGTGMTTLIEAESMTVAGSFVKVELDDASGKAAMRIPGEAECSNKTTGKTPKPIGTATTDFVVSQPAKVTIWLRVKWTGTCSNSFTVVLPNGMKKTITSSTYNNWVWLPAIKGLPLEAGTHSIAVNAREFGTLVDQIFITDDLERTPRGIEIDYSNLK